MEANVANHPKCIVLAEVVRHATTSLAQSEQTRAIAREVMAQYDRVRAGAQDSPDVVGTKYEGPTTGRQRLEVIAHIGEHMQQVWSAGLEEMLYSFALELGVTEAEVEAFNRQEMMADAFESALGMPVEVIIHDHLEPEADAEGERPSRTMFGVPLH